MKTRTLLFAVALLTTAIGGVARPEEVQKKTETARPAPRRPVFILGADISWVQQQEDEGMRFSDHGAQKDILRILKDHGFNWIRLRVFHDPKAEKGYSGKGYRRSAE